MSDPKNDPDDAYDKHRDDKAEQDAELKDTVRGLLSKMVKDANDAEEIAQIIDDIGDIDDLIDNMDEVNKFLDNTEDTDPPPVPVRSMVFAGQSVDVGLDGLFSTFRMGTRWADLEVGEPIQLMVDDLSCDLGGYKPLEQLGQVMAVRIGTYSEMSKMHLGLNHLDYAELGVKIGIVSLKVLLETMYNREIKPDESCTVVYIFRNPVEDV